MRATGYHIAWGYRSHIAGGPGPGDPAEKILLETGDVILTESGDRVLTENSPT